MAGDPAPFVFKQGAYHRNHIFCSLITIPLWYGFFFEPTLSYSSLGPVGKCIACTIFLAQIVRTLRCRKVEVWPDERRFRIREGIWPFLKTTVGTFENAQSLYIWIFVTLGGMGYQARLVYGDKRKLKLIRSMKVTDLTDVARLAIRLNIQVTAPDYMHQKTLKQMESGLGSSPILV